MKSVGSSVSRLRDVRRKPRTHTIYHSCLHTLDSLPVSGLYKIELITVSPVARNAQGADMAFLRSVQLHRI